MKGTPNRLLVLVAMVCLVVAWSVAAGTVDRGNATAWGYAGLSFLAASFLP